MGWGTDCDLLGRRILERLPHPGLSEEGRRVVFRRQLALLLVRPPLSPSSYCLNWLITSILFHTAPFNTTTPKRLVASPISRRRRQTMPSLTPGLTEWFMVRLRQRDF